MAIAKHLASPNGRGTLNYHRIARVVVYLESYVDADDRQVHGGNPIASLEFVAENNEQYAALTTAAYNTIKSTPEFEGAEDV